MSVSVRLDKETEELLDKATRALGQTKTDIIKKSIKQFCKPIVEKKTENLSEFIKTLVKDRPGSGRGDLSMKSEEILREIFRKKRDDRC